MKARKLERLALASATHPRRTIGAWVAAMLVAFVTIGALLGGALTTEGNPTNNPQSQRAKDVREAAFPPSAGAAVTDIVIVESQRYTVDAPAFEAVVHKLAGEIRRADRVESVSTYMTTPRSSLVSKDRHAAMIPFAMPDNSSSGIDDVIASVRSADASPAF